MTAGHSASEAPPRPAQGPRGPDVLAGVGVPRGLVELLLDLRQEGLDVGRLPAALQGRELLRLLLVPLDEDPVGGDDPLGGQEQGGEGVHRLLPPLDAVAIGVALAPLQQVGAGAADLRLLHLHAGRVGGPTQGLGAGVELPDDLRERAGVLGALGAVGNVRN